MIRQAVILAGGRGTRLGSITSNTPKPLLPVGGRPFIEYIIWNLKRYSIKDILLSVGYLGYKMAEHLGDGRKLGVDIDYCFESRPAGTGGAFLLAKRKLDPEFFVINGDTIFDINYHDLATLRKGTNAMAAVALRKVDVVHRYGSVALDGELISGFHEKASTGPGIVNGGVYAMTRDCIACIRSVPYSLESDLFPEIASNGNLAGRLYDGFFIDIGLPETWRDANSVVPSWQKQIISLTASFNTE
jgi:D-glycero-D-manno-heptose 1,7-bisphosphate phosphatase